MISLNIYTQCITKSKMDSEEKVITASVSIRLSVAGIRMMRQNRRRRKFDLFETV